MRKWADCWYIHIKYNDLPHSRGSQVMQWLKNPPAMQERQETWVQSLGWEDPLEKEMATSSSILVWKIP